MRTSLFIALVVVVAVSQTGKVDCSSASNQGPHISPLRQVCDLNNRAIYICTCSGDIVWSLNGKTLKLNHQQPDYSINSSAGAGSTLNISCLTKYNNSKISCSCIDNQSSVESKQAILIIQGLLQSVSDIRRIPSTLIKWSSSSMNGSATFVVVLQDCTNMTNSTTRTKDEFYIFEELIEGHDYKITIYPENSAGLGSANHLKFSLAGVEGCKCWICSHFYCEVVESFLVLFLYLIVIQFIIIFYVIMKYRKIKNGGTEQTREPMLSFTPVKNNDSKDDGSPAPSHL